jgi:hypothetical protein
LAVEENDFSAVLAGRRDLELRRVRRHDNESPRARLACSKRNRLGVIAGGEGDDAARELIPGQR